MKTIVFVVFVTYVFFLMLYTCMFIHFSFFPASDKSFDIRAMDTWTTEQTFAEKRPGWAEHKIFKVSFPRIVFSILFFMLLSLGMILILGLYRLWRALQIILGLLFLLLPWAVMWFTYKTQDNHHILVFRLYPVTWSYVMGLSTSYCISTMTPRKWFVCQVNQLFNKPKAPLLYAITGLLILVTIQILVMDAKFPMPIGANDAPLGWKEWVVALSIVGWLHGIIMLICSSQVIQKDLK